MGCLSMRCRIWRPRYTYRSTLGSRPLSSTSRCWRPCRSRRRLAWRSAITGSLPIGPSRRADFYRRCSPLWLQQRDRVRRHHKFADGPGDPHSPRLAGTGRLSALRGFVHAHVGWLFGHGITNTGVFGRDLLGDPQLLAVNRLYPMLVLAGLLLPGVIAMAADGTVTAALHGAMWGGVLRLVVVQELTFSVNSVCHLWGSRPHERGAFATNNPLLALFTVGSAWHNNHHAFPYSAVFSLRRGEIDIAGLLILGLSKLGLVTDVSKAPSISTHQGE
jgi:fatty-acid desaturase